MHGFLLKSANTITNPRKMCRTRWTENLRHGSTASASPEARPAEDADPGAACSGSSRVWALLSDSAHPDRLTSLPFLRFRR